MYDSLFQNSKKSSNSETVKQEKPDSDVEPDVKKERSPSPPSKRLILRDIYGFCILSFSCEIYESLYELS